VLVDLAQAFSAAKQNVAAFVMVGRLSSLPRDLPVTTSDGPTTTGEFVKSRRAALTGANTAAMPAPSLPVASQTLWTYDVPAQGSQWALDQPAGETELIFASGQGGASPLVALDAKTGEQRWAGPGLSGMPRLQMFGELLMVFDAFALHAVSRDTGASKWRLNYGGSHMWSRMQGGIAVILVIEQNEGTNTYSFIGVDCERGVEIWRTECDPVYHPNICLGDHSVYALSIDGVERKLSRIDLATGETGAAVLLSKMPASMGGLGLAPSGAVYVLTAAGEVELRNSLTLEVTTTWKSAVANPRQAFVTNGKLVVLGNQSEAVGHNPEDGAVAWTVTSPPGSGTMQVATSTDRLYIIATRFSEMPRYYACITIDTAAGRLLKDERLCELQTVEGPLSTSFSPNNPEAFGGGAALPVHVNGARQTDPSNPNSMASEVMPPLMCIINGATGEVTRSKVWEPIAKQPYPVSIKACASGILFCMGRRLALYPSVK
jgi:hypothetical protein